MVTPNNGTPEGFARFANQNGGEIEMGGGGNPISVENGVSFKDLRETTSNDEEGGDKGGDKGFANPMYNSQPANILDNLKNMATENVYSDEPTKKAHENPLYDLMVNIPEEASKVEVLGKYVDVF